MGLVAAVVSGPLVLGVASASWGDETAQVSGARRPVPRNVRSLAELVQCGADEGYVVLSTDYRASAPGEASVHAALRRYLAPRFVAPPTGAVRSARSAASPEAVQLVGIADSPWVTAQDARGAVAAFEVSRLPSGGAAVTTAVICDSALRGPFTLRRGR